MLDRQRLTRNGPASAFLLAIIFLALSLAHYDPADPPAVPSGSVMKEDPMIEPSMFVLVPATPQALPSVRTRRKVSPLRAVEARYWLPVRGVESHMNIVEADAVYVPGFVTLASM